MQLNVLDVYQHTSYALMHQGIFMDAEDDPRCSWMSWTSVDVQVVPCCTNTFLWMLKMTLDAAGCSRWPLMQLDVPGCILMYLVAARCTLMHLDLLFCSLMYLDASGCTNTFLWMPKMTLDAHDDPQCSWMSWMSINTQVLP